MTFVGTEGYIPPEGPGSPRADIYALGKVLYEAFTGLRHRDYPNLPADMEVWWPDYYLLLRLNQVVHQACEADPQQRFQTVQVFRAALERLLTQPEGADQPEMKLELPEAVLLAKPPVAQTSMAETRRVPRRSSFLAGTVRVLSVILWTVLITILVVLVGAALMMWRGSVNAAREEAERDARRDAENARRSQAPAQRESANVGNVPSRPVMPPRPAPSTTPAATNSVTPETHKFNYLDFPANLRTVLDQRRQAIAKGGGFCIAGRVLFGDGKPVTRGRDVLVNFSGNFP
jgi:serine/threonine protein kinase